MTTTATPTDLPTIYSLREGQHVTINHPNYPGEYRVTRIKKVNVLVMPVDGPATSRGLNARPAILRLVHNLDGGIKRSAAVASTLPPLPRQAYFAGEMVRLVRPMLGNSATALFVVINHGPSTVSVALLGGSHGRYLRVAPTNLVRVDIATVIPEGNR